MPEKIKVDIREIYRLLCPECKAKVGQMVKDKLTDQVVKDALEGKSE